MLHIQLLPLKTDSVSLNRAEGQETFVYTYFCGKSGKANKKEINGNTNVVFLQLCTAFDR